MSYTLSLLKQLADDLARQFRPDCRVVIYDPEKHDLEYSIVYISNDHAINRQEGDGPSKVALETLHKDPASLKDHLGYLTRTPNGKVLKSSTIYIRNKEGDFIDYLLSIGYDITGLTTVDHPIKVPIDTEPRADVKQQPGQTAHNVDDLLDTPIEQSVVLIDKPVTLMNKEEKITVIQFLNDAGAFPITESGDKIPKYFGISRFILYSYIDVNSRRSEGRKA